MDTTGLSGDATLAGALGAVATTALAEATTPQQQADARAVIAAAGAITALLGLAPVAGGATTSTSTASTGPTQTITLAPGDTLWTIAAAVYGDPRLYGGLVTLNRLTDPRLQVGQTLIVPAT